jgi:hypothetical protein
MAENKQRVRIGTMPCEGSRCKSHEKKIPVVVFRNDRGTLSYRCDYCDRVKYAKADTDEHDDWMQDITPFEAPAAPVVKAAPAAKKNPAPAAPAPGKKSTVFG